MGLPFIVLSYPHTHPHKHKHRHTVIAVSAAACYVVGADVKLLLFSSHMKGFELHFCESQRVAVALPVIPHHTVRVRRCVVAGVVVVAVQVGVMTAGAVPPATFVVHCTRV